MPLNFLEDWLMFMGGKVDLNGNPYNDPWRTSKPIKLATYDMRFIESVCSSIARSQGLTDKQIDLAIKVILKYQRQWAALNLDPSYLTTADIPLKLPQREIDRSYTIRATQDTLLMKFPYEPKLINQLHDVRDGAYGNWAWLNEEKVWNIDLAEINIHHLVSCPDFANKEWQYDSKASDLIELAKYLIKNPNTVGPRMGIVDDEMVLIDVADSARESMLELGWSPNADRFRSCLLAIKHAISLSDEMIDTLPPLEKAIVCAQANQADYPGRSDITWSDMRSIMRSNPSMEYVFLYRGNNMPKVISQTQMIDTCDKEYVTIGTGQITEIKSERSNAIIVTDVLIGADRIKELIAQQGLAVLYMIPDDETGNA